MAESADDPDGALPAATGDLLSRAESAYRAAVANPATAEATAAAIVAEARLQGSIEPLVVSCGPRPGRLERCSTAHGQCGC